MAQDEGARLGKGNLSLPDAVAQSVGYMGPVFSGTFFIPIIAGLSLTGRGAGIATPFAILLTAIGMLGLAWIISRYAKRIHAAGALYDYVSEGFGRPIGLLAGWVYYGGALMLTLAIGLAFGGFTSGVLETVARRQHRLDLATLAFWLVAWAISVLGVRISTRAQLFLALFSVVVVFGWAIYVILKGGSDGFSMSPFNPGESSFSGITYGIVYARTDLRGLRVGGQSGRGDGPSQAQHPARDLLQRGRGSRLLRRAGLGAPARLRSRSGGALQELPAALCGHQQPRLRRHAVRRVRAVAGRHRHRRGRPGHRHLDDAGIFALARDEHLPKPLAAVHPKYKTPYIAASAVSIAAIIVALIVNWTEVSAPGLDTDASGSRSSSSGRPSGPSCSSSSTCDRADGLQGATRREPRGPDVAGIVGGLTSVAALYGVVHKAPSLYWFDKIWWLALIWIVVGIVIVLVSKSRGTLRHTHLPCPIGTRFCGWGAAGVSPAEAQRRDAMRCAQATRSSIGTCSSTAWARWSRRGRSRPPGCPPRPSSVAPSCQLSRPPSSARRPRSRPRRDERLHERDRARRPPPAARLRRPRRSRRVRGEPGVARRGLGDPPPRTRARRRPVAGLSARSGRYSMWQSSVQRAG